MESRIIDISNWEYFYQLYDAQVKVDSNVYILEYFLNNNVDINNEHYQYYQKEYIHSCFDLSEMKNKLSEYLRNFITDKFQWSVNFIKKEVIIDYV